MIMGWERYLLICPVQIGSISKNYGYVTSFDISDNDTIANI